MFKKEILEYEAKLKMKRLKQEKLRKEVMKIEEEIEEIGNKIEKLKEFTDTSKLEEEEKNYLTLEPLRESKFSENISKKEAINFINENFDLGLNNRNTIFSSRNNTTLEWWFEPNKNKFIDGFYIILKHEKKRKLYIFEIPEREFPQPEKRFYYRADREQCSFRIDGNDTKKFKDKLKPTKPDMNFIDYLVASLDY